MNRRWRRLLLSFCGLLLISGLVLLLAREFLLRKTLEQWASSRAGTPVRIAELEIDEKILRGIEIGPPENYYVEIESVRINSLDPAKFKNLQSDAAIRLSLPELPVLTLRKISILLLDRKDLLINGDLSELNPLLRSLGSVEALEGTFSIICDLANRDKDGAWSVRIALSNSRVRSCSGKSEFSAAAAALTIRVNTSGNKIRLSAKQLAPYFGQDLVRGLEQKPTGSLEK
jgi:uncharacterized protein YhdP